VKLRPGQTFKLGGEVKVRFFTSRWQWFVVLVLIAVMCLALPQDWWGSNHLPAAVVATLQQADRFELLSLGPSLQSAFEPGGFHGYRILSRVVISDTKARYQLISALR